MKFDSSGMFIWDSDIRVGYERLRWASRIHIQFEMDVHIPEGLIDDLSHGRVSPIAPIVITAYLYRRSIKKKHENWIRVESKGGTNVGMCRSQTCTPDEYLRSI